MHSLLLHPELELLDAVLSCAETLPPPLRDEMHNGFLVLVCQLALASTIRILQCREQLLPLELVLPPDSVLHSLLARTLATDGLDLTSDLRPLLFCFLPQVSSLCRRRRRKALRMHSDSVFHGLGSDEWVRKLRA